MLLGVIACQLAPLLPGHSLAQYLEAGTKMLPLSEHLQAAEVVQMESSRSIIAQKNAEIRWVGGMGGCQVCGMAVSGGRVASSQADRPWVRVSSQGV